MHIIPAKPVERYTHLFYKGENPILAGMGVVGIIIISTFVGAYLSVLLFGSSPEKGIAAAQEMGKNLDGSLAPGVTIVASVISFGAITIFDTFIGVVGFLFSGFMSVTICFFWVLIRKDILKL